MSLNREKVSVRATKKTKDGYPMRKYAYGEKLIQLLESSQKILVIGVDHIGSKKLGELRRQYRGRARFLFGKNTLMRRILRQYVRKTGRLEVSSLASALRGNCCLVFLNGHPSIYEMVEFQNELVRKSRITCVPRAGDIAPCEVVIRPMDTGLEPTQTSGFAAMNIATKINRGQIQIVSRVCLLKAGDRVGASEAALLHKLGMKPFSYAIEPVALYDEGECYPVGAEGLFGGPSPNLLMVPGSVRSAYAMMIAFGLESLEKYQWDGLSDFQRVLEGAKQQNYHQGERLALYDGGVASDDDCSTGDDSSTHVNPFLIDDSSSEEDSDTDDSDE